MVVAMPAGASLNACSPALTFAGLATVDDDVDADAEEVTGSAADWEPAVDDVPT
jgi:hypothetical protein